MRTYLTSFLIGCLLMSVAPVRAQFAVTETQSKAQSELSLAQQSTASLLNALSTATFATGSSAKLEKAKSQINQAKDLPGLKSSTQSALGLILSGKWRSEADRSRAMQTVESARSTKDWGKALVQIESALRTDAFNGFWKTQRTQWIQSLQRL